MKRKSYITVRERVKIPSWAMCYLINGEDSALDAEDKKLVDDWVEKMREGGRIDICYSKEGAEAYFCSHPAFGLPSDVEDCDVVVDKRPRYAHCAYPCCGQSRFEPIQRQAIDGKWLWTLYDNKEHRFFPGCRHKTRKELIIRLFLAFKREELDYEPDDDRRTLAWLKTQTEIPK